MCVKFEKDAVLFRFLYMVRRILIGRVALRMLAHRCLRTIPIPSSFCCNYYVCQVWKRCCVIQVPIHGETDSDWTSSSQDAGSPLPPYHPYPQLFLPPYSLPLPPPSLSYAQVTFYCVYLIFKTLINFQLFFHTYSKDHYEEIVEFQFRLVSLKFL
jgi:hypothetical protein